MSNPSSCCSPGQRRAPPRPSRLWLVLPPSRPAHPVRIRGDSKRSTTHAQTSSECLMTTQLRDRLTALLEGGQLGGLHAVVAVRGGQTLLEYYGAGEDFA